MDILIHCKTHFKRTVISILKRIERDVRNVMTITFKNGDVSKKISIDNKDRIEIGYLDHKHGFYVGEFKNDKYHGIGMLVTLVDDYKVFYIGEFKELEVCGIGASITEVDTDLTILNASDEKIDDLLDNPKGTGIFDVGTWVGGSLNGEGHRTFLKSGSRYSGSFRDGLQHGHGVTRYNDIEYYDGEYQNGKPNGFGTRQFREKLYSGQFKNGKFDGIGKVTYQDKIIYAHFVAGKFFGRATLHDLINHDVLMMSDYTDMIIDGVAIRTSTDDAKTNSFKEYYDRGMLVHKKEIPLVPVRTLSTFVSYEQYKEEKERIKSLEFENDLLKSQMLVLKKTGFHSNDLMCTLCHVHEKNIVLVPCGHVCVCSECGDRIVRCPVCKIVITSILYLYFVS